MMIGNFHMQYLCGVALLCSSVSQVAAGQCRAEDCSSSMGSYAPVCPGAYTATGCCYKNCKSETIPKNAIQTTIHPSDGWDIVSDALIGAAEDIYEVVCDFGGAVCEYADSDVGEAVDTIAKITTKVPGVVGEASQAYKKIKKTLTRAFMCRNGDSITCAATSAALSSGAARSCPATTKTAFLLGTTLAVSHCTLL